MAKNGSRDRSASRSRSAKKGKDKRSRSRSPKKKKDRSVSRKKKERSPSRKRKRSPSKSKGVTKNPKGMNQQFQHQKGGKAVAKKASVSPDREDRRSPSYDKKGRASPSRSASRGSNSDRSSDAKEPKPKEFEVVEVTLKDRPFGMAPSKEAGVSGYVVSKVADDKPAGEAGVKPGWHLVSIAGKPCKELDLEAIQVLLKGAELPMACEFEREKEDVPEKGEDDSDEEIDILDARAEYRFAHQSGLDAIDALPVERSTNVGGSAEDLPQPINDWQDACNRKYLNKTVMDKLTAAGLKRPTLIQRHAIPIINHESGHWDMIASAQTGSGKTFAFVIPTVGRLITEGAAPRPFFSGSAAQATPLVLVLSPTRELAMQTTKEIEVLTKGSSPPLTVMSIYGGESLKFQQQKLVNKQTDIICATPGRLVDLVDAGKISLSFIQSVVLDEADQMFEQSLEIMCTEILTQRDMPPPEGRQTLLFSATMPQKIKDLCPRILRQKEGRIANLSVGHYQDNKGGGCASIKQILRWVPEESHRSMAMVQDLNKLWIQQMGRKGRIVIFTNQRIQAGSLANSLTNNGIPCLHLHGKLDQPTREDVFDKFRTGQADVLVATNVASRGLDFPDISFVVQYNMPGTIDIYTHRIGRTGRVGQVGCALAYVGPKDKHLFPKLTDFLEMNKQEVPSFLKPATQRSPPRRSGGGYRSRSRGGDRRGGGGGYDRGGGGYDRGKGGSKGGGGYDRGKGSKGGYDDRRGRY